MKKFEVGDIKEWTFEPPGAGMTPCRACGQPAPRSERRAAARTLPRAVRRRLRRATFPYHEQCAIEVQRQLIAEMAD
jgi:hypothetical protein